MEVDHYRRAVASARSAVRLIQPLHLDMPTPCESWSVRDLIVHMVDAAAFTAVVMEAGDSSSYLYQPIDPVKDDCLSRFDDSSTRLLTAFQVDGALSKIVTMPVVGDLPGATLLVLATCDALVHGWDLGTAIGDTPIVDDDLAGSVLQEMGQLMTENMRGADGTALFAPEVKASSNASTAQRLLAFLGRRPVVDIRALT